MSFQPLKPEIAAKVLELRTHASENQIWAAEASIMKENSKKMSHRILLLTECGLYIIKKSRIKPYELSKTESIFSLSGCQIIKDHTISVNFKDTNYTFVLPETGALLENLFRVYRSITWNLNTDNVKEISTIKEAQSYPMPNDRPPNVMLYRYISAAIDHDMQIEKEAVDLITKFELHPRKVILLSNFNLQSPAPLFFALSLEPDLRTIILDNFSPNNLGIIISYILVSTNKFTNLTLKNYDQVNLKGMLTRRSDFNSCNMINIQSCKPDFIHSFLSSIRNAAYSITSFVFQDLLISDSNCPLLLKALQSFAFFANLSAIAFINAQCELPLMEYIVQILRAKDTIKQLIVENCGIDVCQILSQIYQISHNLQTLSLRRNYGHFVLSEEEKISFSIMHLDIGDCEFTAKALTAFLHSLCRWSRKLPFVLDIDHTHLNTAWNEVMSHLPMESLRSVITELNMSNNVMDSSSFEQFLAFLATQSPLLTTSPYKLMYLSLSSCFVDQVSDCISQLLRFCMMREIWGLAISDLITSTNADLMDSILTQLNQIRGLVSLDISGNYIQSSAAQNLLKFVRDSTSIAEIAFDRCGILDSEQMLYLYECLILSPHLLGFQKPIEDLKPISHYSETKKINNLLRNKRQHSTTSQRLTLYLSLFKDFSTRVISNRITTNELAEDNPLFEQNFINPIPSLFTLNSSVTSDVDIDPLATMVTEYLSTSGKYGIVPPTAPPTQPPNSHFALPPIFATMQPYTDKDPAFKFDESLVDFQFLSSQFSSRILQNANKISIKDSQQQSKINYKQYSLLPIYASEQQ